MAAVVNVQILTRQRTGTELNKTLSGEGATAPRAFVQRLINFIASILAGVLGARFRVQLDDSTGVGASGTVACTQASATAGDKLFLDGIPLTAVAGTPDASLGQFAIITSDTAMATSLKNAINGHTTLGKQFLATSSTGTVTITAIEKGTPGNAIRMFKAVTTSGALTLSGATLSGGRDPGDKQSLTAALSGALTANDTVTIGSVVLTAKASPANENEFAATVSAAADGAALAACINAHSKLKGLLLASGTSTVTVQMRQGGRIGALVSIAKSAAAITLSAASFAPTTTEAWAASPVEVALGAL